jgi:AraC-like DNA-binding protein
MVMVHTTGKEAKPSLQFVHADTANVPAAHREDYWNEIVKRHVVQLDCKAESSQQFLCTLDGFSSAHGSAARIGVARRLAVRRDPKAVDREASDMVVFNLLLAGQMQVSQGDNTCTLGAGDFSICTADRQYQLQIPDSMQVACFRIPLGSLGCNRTMLHRLAACRIGTSTGMGALLKAYAVALSDQQAGQGRLNTDVALPQLGVLLGAAIGEVLDNDSSLAPHHRERLLLQARSYVARHIDDPDLSVANVASAMKISTRYLQQLWSGEDDALSAHIVRLRLKRVADSLRNPLRRRESLTQIAMSHGFNNMSHFSRSFRQHYGITPSDFQRATSLATDRASSARTAVMA